MPVNAADRRRQAEMVVEVEPRADATLHGQDIVNQPVALQVAAREIVVSREVAQIALQHRRPLDAIQTKRLGRTDVPPPPSFATLSSATLPPRKE